MVFKSRIIPKKVQHPGHSYNLSFILFFVLTVLLIGSVRAFELNGRLSSSFYGMERSNESYWKNYTRLNTTANLWQASNFRSLSLHANVRIRENLSDDPLVGSQTYVYNLYLKYRGFSGMTAYAGRQFAYNLLGSAILDGARIKYRFRKNFNLDIFGGAVTSNESPDEIQSFSEDNILGGRFEYSSPRSFGAALNWLMMRSDDALNRHRIGIEGWATKNRLNLYAQTSYDLLNLNLAGTLFRANMRLPKWYLSAEFDWRKPSVDGNSLFSLIDANRYTGLRFDLTRKINRQLSVIAQYHHEFLEGSDSWRSVLGIRTYNYMVSWQHRDGYGGESDGFRIQANLKIRPDLDAYSSLFLSKYIVQSETPDKIDAYSSNLGLSWYPGNALKIMIEGQYLKNAVEENDYRLFFKVIKGFSFRSSETGK